MYSRQFVVRRKFSSPAVVGVLPLSIAGVTYAALTALFLSSWLLLIWGSVIAAGWLMARSRKADGRTGDPAVSGSFHPVGPPGFER